MNSEKEFVDKIIGKTSEEQYENSIENLTLSEIINGLQKNDNQRSKKNSSANEMISINDNEEERAIEYFNDKFSDQDWENIKGRELNKSVEHIEIINLVNHETNKLLKKHGLKEFDVPCDNIHLFNSNEYNNIFGPCAKNTSSFFDLRNQAVIMNQSELYPKIIFAHKIFHEFLHFKSFQSIYSENKKFSQGGIYINLRKENDDSKNYHFFNLNEAITEELSIRFHKDIISNNSKFKEEVDFINSFVEDELKNGKKLNKDEIMAVVKKTTYSSDNKKEHIKKIRLKASYFRQRKILNILIEKLFEKNQDKFKDREEVFDLFVKSVFTGNIVGKGSWGRLIDETFGSGTLKSLMEMDSNLKSLESLKEFVNNLK